MDHQNHSLLFKFAESFIWDLPNEEFCDKFEAISILCTITEIFFLVVLSHLLHMFLKRFEQPSIVSQMLAGFLLGPTILNRFNLLNRDMTQVEYVASLVRIFFMFLSGLEIDISYLQRMFGNAAIITMGNMLLCVPLGIMVGLYLHHLIHSSGSIVIFVLILFLMFFNSASPIVIRVLNELKLAMTDIGKLAISTALVMDVMCLVTLGLLDVSDVKHHKHGDRITKMIIAFIVALVLVAVTSTVIRRTVKWLNERNRHKRVIGDDMVFYLVLIVLGSSLYMRFLGYDPMMGAFIYGLVIQRDGLTARTIIERLTYASQNLILPVYFGVAGLQVDFGYLRFKEVFITTAMVIFFGIIGKIGGTMIGAKCVGIPLHDGLVLSLLLNMKGQVNLMIISLGKTYKLWSNKTHMALLISLFFNSLTTCPATAYIVRRERKMKRYYYQRIEWLNLENDLRMVACVHSPGDVPTILDLIEISSGANRHHLAPYILHLMEITSNATNTTHYHQLQDNDYDNDMGGHQAQQVNAAIDTFVKETDIRLRQRTVVSRFDSMHEDLHYGVQELHASLAIIPFHRKQRFDGKMGAGKDDIREFNMNALQHVPCSVGILVDRGLGKEQKDGTKNGSSSLLSDGSTTLLHLVVLFLGGPDDREAAAYAARLAMHPCVNVTIMRFLPESMQCVQVYLRTCSVAGNGIAVKVQAEDADEIFMANFYNRFVATGIITYVERLVENSTDLLTTLSSMEGMYSLYIMGRQIQGPAARLTLGMRDWQECPELGIIGDLLASSDFMLNGSVLVIQQYDITS